jgi:hypothetical protein
LPRAPVEVDVVIRLGAVAAHARSLEIEYLRERDRQLSRRVTFRYAPGAAPVEQVHRAHLAPGRYAVTLRLEDDHGAIGTRERPLDVGGRGERSYLDY